jgi:hypothetical protein
MTEQTASGTAMKLPLSFVTMGNSTLPTWMVVLICIAIFLDILWGARLEERRRQRENQPHTRKDSAFTNVSMRSEAMKSYRCPCCQFKTLDERGIYDICPVCFWEDDGQDDHDAEVVRGGPNGSLSLTDARRNFREYGASDMSRLAHVRSPLPEEE